MKGESIITGAGLVSALGNTTEAFHRELCGGMSAIKSISEMDGRQIHPARPAAPIPDFDPRSLLGEQNFKPLDRSGQMTIAAVGLALEDAGWTTEHLEATEMDLVVGTMFCNVRTIIQFDRSVLETGPKYAKPLDFANTVINAAGGQTAIWHNLRGANTTVSGGKVSGLRAIRHARLQHARGGSAPAVVGGMEVLSFEMMEIFGKANVLAETVETARPFRQDRSGFALGEAAAFMVIESPAAATGRGARLLGRIAGMGSSYDISRGSDPANAVSRLVDSTNQALREAGLTANELDFVICSQNGSPREDAYETEALGRIFKGRAGPIPAMSLAGNIGETMGASGALQVIAALEILRTGAFPGSRGSDPVSASLCIPQDVLEGNFRQGLIVSIGLDGCSNALIISKS